METKKQERRISDSEMSLLKNTFAENDALLKTMRRAMLGLTITADESSTLSYLIKNNVALQQVIRKIFLPEIDGDAPLGQQLDLWMTVQIADKTPELAHLLLQSRERLIKLIEQGLNNLANPSSFLGIEQFSLPGDIDQSYVWLTTRNTYINHVESQLLQIKFLAGMTDETVAETQERLSKNSTK
jgi:hypothetical protein